LSNPRKEIFAEIKIFLSLTKYQNEEGIWGKYCDNRC
jgi:hypothetical protein